MPASSDNFIPDYAKESENNQQLASQSANAHPKDLVPLDEIEDLNEIYKRLAHHETEFIKGNGARDYSQSSAYQNVAIYTPALSLGVVNDLQDALNQDADASVPNAFDFLGPDFDICAEDLLQINPNSKLCFYPWLLYSAGQAAKTNKLANEINWLTYTPREPRVVVVGDSGGFQIQEQTIKFRGNKTVQQMMAWQERVADYSTTLDFPLGKAFLGNIMPYIQKMSAAKKKALYRQVDKTGFDPSFITALNQTVQNNHYYEQNRTIGKTKFLNVIQGRNEEESRYWYDEVKQFPFEGWSFAGRHHTELAMTLRRVMNLRDEGRLKPGMWFHFLGVSTFKVAAALTYLQRAIRKHTKAKNLQITFDSKSSFDAVINGYQPVIGYNLDPQHWSFRPQKVNLVDCLTDNRKICDIGYEWKMGGENRVLAKTAIGTRVSMNQLVTQRPDGRVLPNRYQQLLLVHHNAQAYFEGFRRIYGMLDEKSILQRPQSVRAMETLINAAFDAENPYSFIDDAEKELDAIAMEQL